MQSVEVPMVDIYDDVVGGIDPTYSTIPVIDPTNDQQSEYGIYNYNTSMRIHIHTLKAYTHTAIILLFSWFKFVFILEHHYDHGLVSEHRWSSFTLP